LIRWPTRTPAGETRRIVYYDAIFRVQKDTDFGAWDAPGMAALVSALGAGPKGVSGVQSVGVSSGPDGEFVFAVTHSPETNLRDAVPSLPSFQARVTSSTDGSVHVTAHDPEADA